MNSLVAVVFLTLFVLVLYAVLGGADFGGGVWDLLASGPRRGAQRDAITHAIGPVWEANHVWLIFANVILFTCFPVAFAAIFTGLYAPLSFALAGVVLRGAAFVFRNYATDSRVLARSWSAVFGVASLIAPFFFGDAAGALAAGDFAWTSPFALSVGVFAIAVCAQIAATFILREVGEGAVQADFRRRAVRATIAVWVVGLLPAALAALGEPKLFASLQRASAFPAVVVALLAGIGVIACVVTRRDRTARFAVAIEAAAVLAGWFGAQAPDAIAGHLTLAQAASAAPILNAFLVASAIGAIVLVPSLAMLFRVFKTSVPGRDVRVSE